MTIVDIFPTCLMPSRCNPRSFQYDTFLNAPKYPSTEKELEAILSAKVTHSRNCRMYLYGVPHASSTSESMIYPSQQPYGSTGIITVCSIDTKVQICPVTWLRS